MAYRRNKCLVAGRHRKPIVDYWNVACVPTVHIMFIRTQSLSNVLSPLPLLR